MPWSPKPRRRRPNARQRGYDRAWEALRAIVLAEEPYCRECGAGATDVDHRLSRARGGTDDRANLVPLCHAHHSRKTAMEDHGFGN